MPRDIDAYAQRLRRLVDEYCQKRLTFEDYRAQRKRIFDDIEAECAGEVRRDDAASANAASLGQ